MMIRPAMAERRATSFKAAWVKVPCFFCFAVWVGWRMRMPWMKKRTAAELRSWTVLSAVIRWRGWMGETYGVGGEEHQVMAEDAAPDDGC